MVKHMALVKSNPGPRDLAYAIIQGISADKSSNRLRVNVGFWFCKEDRFNNLSPGETVAPTEKCKDYIIDGFFANPADMYLTLSSHPDFAGWESDEVPA